MIFLMTHVHFQANHLVTHVHLKANHLMTCDI
jgi:hypothetical protein